MNHFPLKHQYEKVKLCTIFLVPLFLAVSIISCAQNQKTPQTNAEDEAPLAHQSYSQYTEDEEEDYTEDEIPEYQPYLKDSRIDTVFHKNFSVIYSSKFKEENSSFIDSCVVTLLATVPVTHHPTIDSLLVNEIYHISANPDAPFTNNMGTLPPYIYTQRELHKTLQRLMQAYINEAKSFPTVGIGNYVECSMKENPLHYLFTFEASNFVFWGGAHGLSTTHYLHVNTKKGQLVKLSDVLLPQKEEELRQLLWKIYAEEYTQIPENTEPYCSIEDFYISPSFHFANSGITFVYPPYAIASYAEGEQTIYVPWMEINDYLRPEYRHSIAG